MYEIIIFVFVGVDKNFFLFGKFFGKYVFNMCMEEMGYILIE